LLPIQKNIIQSIRKKQNIVLKTGSGKQQNQMFSQYNPVSSEKKRCAGKLSAENNFSSETVNFTAFSAKKRCNRSVKWRKRLACDGRNSNQARAVR